MFPTVSDLSHLPMLEAEFPIKDWKGRNEKKEKKEKKRKRRILDRRLEESTKKMIEGKTE